MGMKGLTLLLGLVAFGSAKKIEDSFCLDGSEAWIKNNQADVEPYPIILAPGKTITIKAGLELLKEIPLGAKVKLDIVRNSVVDIPIPYFPVGSCTYDGDRVMKRFEPFIHDKMPPGQECKLPIKPGKFGGSANGVTVTIPSDIPEEILNLGAGVYTAEATQLDANDNAVFCIRVKIEVEV